MRVLLDTCTFLWLTHDAPELSDTVKEIFTEIKNELYLSVVSVWEITSAAGRREGDSAPAMKEEPASARYAAALSGAPDLVNMGTGPVRLQVRTSRRA